MASFGFGMADFAKSAGKFAIDGVANWMKFEDVTLKTLRTIGLTGEQLRGINNALIKDTIKLGVQYGVSLEKLAEIQRSLNDITKTAKVMSSQTLEMSVAMGKLVGDRNVQEWQGAMHKFGMDAQAANTWLGKGQIEAKKLGLNAEKFTEEMAKSANLMNKMHFRTGISGLEKMIGMATRLGTSLETMTKHINIDGGAFSTIEGSIDAAAKLQRMGGSLGAEFANPLEVMAEGMFDAEAAAERIERIVSNRGVFNEKTGMVDLSWKDKKELGVAAEALGMSPDELRTMAMQSQKGQRIEQDLRSSGAMGQFSKDQIDSIKNLAQWNAEKKQFEIVTKDSRGNEHRQNVKEMTPEELAKAVQLSKEEKSIDQNVASIEGQVRLIADTMQGRAKDVTSASEVREGAVNSWEALKANVIQYLGLDTAVTKVKGAFQALGDIFGHEDGGIVQPSPSGLEGVPRFDTGGIIGGNSTHGDRVLTRVNSGEMVLNRGQQANLFNAINKNSMAGSGGTRALLLNKAPQILQSTGNIVANAGQTISNAVQSFSVSSKGFTQWAKLGKSFGKAAAVDAVTGVPGSGLMSSRNLFARFMRSKLYKASPELAKAWEGSSRLVGRVTGGIGNASRAVGGWLKNSYVGQEVRTVLNDVKSVGRAVTSSAKAVGSKIANSKLVTQGISNTRGLIAGTRMQLELAKTSKLGQGISSAASKFSSAASRFGNGVKNFGSATKDIGTNIAKGVGRIGGKAISLGGKAASKAGALLGKAGSGIKNGVGKIATKALGKTGAKMLGKAIPGLGGALTVGLAAVDGFNAIKDFSKVKGEIEARTDLSKKEKKELMRQAEDDRNEKVGGAVGAVAGAALGSIAGPLGTAIGGFIGEKVGGFIGKNVNNVKDFLFGKEAELTEEEEAQQEYEESKFGEVGIEDPQLMEKAAMATCAMHDLLISIWYHMNGKASNGEDNKEGFLSKAGKGLAAAAGLITMPLATVGGAIGGLFGKKKKGDKEKEIAENTEYQETLINNLTEINTNVAALLENKTENAEGDARIKYKNGGLLDFIAKTTIGATAGPLGVLASNMSPNIISKPIGEESLEVTPATSENSGNFAQQEQKQSEPIKIEISGTIKLEGVGGSSMDIDVNELFDKPENRRALTEIISKQMMYNGANGGFNANSKFGQRQTGFFGWW